MDLCMSYLYEASKLANEYKEVDLYQEIFEGSAMDAINAQNEQIAGKSESLLTKAVNLIKSIIRKAQEIISNIMTWFKADDSEKNEFKKFREECKRNPEFANKKITLTNWREIESKYSKAINKAEAAYKTIKDEEESSKPKILASLGKYLGNIVKAGTMSVTVEAALKYAEESQLVASGIKKGLDYDLKVLDTLEATIGKKETKKFQKKINGLNSKLAIRRWIAGARQKESEECKNRLKGIINSIRNAYLDSKPSRTARVLKRARGNEDFKSATNGITKGIIGTAKDALKQNKGLLKLSAKNMINNARTQGKDSPGYFDIKVDNIITQFSDSKFSGENLAKCSRNELRNLLSEADEVNRTLKGVINLRKKDVKKFSIQSKREWNKTLEAQARVNRLVNQIEHYLYH